MVGGDHLQDWVGLRPGRASVRLERELVGGLNIVHNYGHGGSGITTFQVIVKTTIQYDIIDVNMD